MSRYRVDCDEGQLLSYSIHDLRLEGNGTCDGELKCLDFLKIDLPGRAEEEMLCGTQNFDDSFFLDGQSSVQMEFDANRGNQGRGFLLVVTCATPGFTSPRVQESKKRAAHYGDKPEVEYSNCTFPPHKKSLQPGVIKLLVSNSIALL